MFNYSTDLGEIHLSNNVVKKIIMDAVDKQNGNAEVHNYKGGYREMFADQASKMNIYDDKSGAIDIEETEEGLDITVRIVVRFGKSIHNIAEGIIDYIYKEFESVLLEKPKHVKVIVTGVASKSIAKRKLEFEK